MAGFSLPSHQPEPLGTQPVDGESGESQCSHLKNGDLELKASKWPSGSETTDGTGTLLVMFP